MVCLPYQFQQFGSAGPAKGPILQPAQASAFFLLLRLAVAIITMFIEASLFFPVI
jgi:hypothetical protein